MDQVSEIRILGTQNQLKMGFRQVEQQVSTLPKIWQKWKICSFGCVALPWHFEFYILKCKIFLINFLDELGNFKQKNFYTSKCKIFYILKQQTLT